MKIGLFCSLCGEILLAASFWTCALQAAQGVVNETYPSAETCALDNSGFVITSGLCVEPLTQKLPPLPPDLSIRNAAPAKSTSLQPPWSSYHYLTLALVFHTAIRRSRFFVDLQIGRYQDEETPHVSLKICDFHPAFCFYFFISLLESLAAGVFEV